MRRSICGATRRYSRVVATPLLMELIIVRVVISALPQIAAAAEVEAEVLVAVEEARVVEVAPSSCKGA